MSSMAVENNQFAIVPIEAVTAPFHKAWVKRIVKGVGKRHIQDVLAENGMRKQDVESQLREAQILQTAHEAEANETRAQLDQATQEVSKAIDDELAAARNFGKLKSDREDIMSQKLVLRNQLLDAQKKLAMLEVLATSNAKLKEIKRQQAAATKAAEKAAEDAKEFVVAHKRLQKEVAEATRRAQAGLTEQKSSRRSHALRRGISSKRLLRAFTHRIDEPKLKYPRKGVTYDIEDPHPKYSTLTKEINGIPASPSKRSDVVADEVPATLIQPSLSCRTTLPAQPSLSCQTTLPAQLALARCSTETLQEDAQPPGSL